MRLPFSIRADKTSRLSHCTLGTPERRTLQEGIRPGQQLLSISDPIRNNEVWKISIETKLSRVRDALQFRSPPTLSLQLTESSIEDETGFEWG